MANSKSTATGARIIRYTVMERGSGDWHLESTHRTPAEAAARLAYRRSARAFRDCQNDLRLGGMFELTLNARGAAVADRVDALLTNIGHDDRCTWHECIGTADELVAAGLAEPYIFERLGRSRTRNGINEFGDRYTLEPRGKSGRFLVRRGFKDDAYLPHANARLPDGAPRRLQDVDVVRCSRDSLSARESDHDGARRSRGNPRSKEWHRRSAASTRPDKPLHGQDGREG